MATLANSKTARRGRHDYDRKADRQFHKRVALHPEPREPQQSGHFIVLPPGTSGAVVMWIPWCTSQADFQADHFIEIGNWTQVGNLLNPVREYIIWQHDRGTWWGKDGDHIRFSTDGQWHDMNENWIGGVSAVDGDRNLTVSQINAADGLSLARA
jgi:hypothetical protein